MFCNPVDQRAHGCILTQRLPLIKFNYRGWKSSKCVHLIESLRFFSPLPLSSFTPEDNLLEALPEPMPEGQSNKAPIRAGFAAC